MINTIEKINPEDAAKLGLVPMGKQHPLRVMIDDMEKGEMLKVPRSEFTWKGQTPALFLRQVEKKGKKRFRLLKMRAEPGWIIERTL